MATKIKKNYLSYSPIRLANKFSLKICKNFPVEIINVDSVQVLKKWISDLQSPQKNHYQTVVII